MGEARLRRKERVGGRAGRVGERGGLASGAGWRAEWGEDMGRAGSECGRR
jgi:hypothetical protein